MNTPPPSQSGASRERVTVRASTAVQGGGGVNFGKLVWVEGTRLYVQADTSLQPGEGVVLRVDLSPVPGTAMLRGVVARVLPTAPGEAQAYLVRLDSVSGDDEVRWTQFLHAKRSGGTLSDLSDVRDSGSAMKPTYASVADRERRAVLEKMSGTSRHPTGLGTGPVSSSSATWSSSAVSEGGGRAAMRDALKAAMGRAQAPAGQGPSAAPPPPPPPPPPAPSGSAGTRYVATPSFAQSTASGATRSTASSSTSAAGASTPPRSVASGWSPPPSRPGHGPAPAPPPAAVAPGTPLAEDPSWIASNLGGTTYVQVEWRTGDAFSFDVHTQLSAGVLTLLSDGRPLPQAGNIVFVLKYQTVVVQAKGTVAEHQVFTATYRVELDASHLAELRRSARSTSTVSGVTAVDPNRRR